MNLTHLLVAILINKHLKKLQQSLSVEFYCLLDPLPCKNSNCATLAISRETKLTRSQHRLWKILQQILCNLGLVCQRPSEGEDQHRSVIKTARVKRDGNKWRETNLENPRFPKRKWWRPGNPGGRIPGSVTQCPSSAWAGGRGWVPSPGCSSPAPATSHCTLHPRDALCTNFPPFKHSCWWETEKYFMN